MTRYHDAAILALRLFIAFTFLSAVADRFGLWGAPGESGVAWGTWENFVTYTTQANSFFPESFGGFLAATATALEVILGVMLIAGFKTRMAAVGSALLLTAFALAMAVSFGFKSPFDYSVWVDAGAAFLLATVARYRWSVDDRS